MTAKTWAYAQDESKPANRMGRPLPPQAATFSWETAAVELPFLIQLAEIMDISVLQCEEIQGDKMGNIIYNIYIQPMWICQKRGSPFMATMIRKEN